MSIADSMNEKKRNTNKFLVETPEEKRPLGRSRHTWVNNIKTGLGEIGLGGMDWTGLAQDRDKWKDLVNAVLNLHVPYNVMKFLGGCTTVASRVVFSSTDLVI
jgi:hypothetical protein